MKSESLSKDRLNFGDLEIKKIEVKAMFNNMALFYIRSVIIMLRCYYEKTNKSSRGNY